MFACFLGMPKIVANTIIQSFISLMSLFSISRKKYNKKKKKSLFSHTLTRFLVKQPTIFSFYFISFYTFTSLSSPHPIYAHLSLHLTFNFKHKLNSSHLSSSLISGSLISPPFLKASRTFKLQVSRR